jgi:hypothetical protein
MSEAFVHSPHPVFLIISQMKLIGELMREGKSDFEILVDRYGTFNTKHILVAELDIWNPAAASTLRLEEYYET